MRKKLSSSEIYKNTNMDLFNFTTTNDIEPLNEEIVQQEEAKQTIQFGLAIEKYGYNMFVSGSSTAKKRSYLKQVINNFASRKETPNDLLYVYNFENRSEPTLISLPSGKGSSFKEDMEKFLSNLTDSVEKVFDSEIYHKSIESILQEYDLLFEELYATYKKELEQYNYTLIETEQGIMPTVIKEGEVLDQEGYDDLSEEEKEGYIANRKNVDMIMIEVSYKENEIEKKKEEELHKFDEKLMKKSINRPLNKIKKEYGDFNEVVNHYIDSIKKDIIENIDSLKPKKEQQAQNLIQIVSGGGGGQEKSIEDNLKYKVNLLVDNKKTEHAPVIFMDEVDHHNLFGTVEFDVAGNALTTDFTKIRSGELIKANGGYLVIKVEDLFRYHMLWDRLKTALRSQEANISTSRYRDVVISNTLDPQPIPLDVKIVLLGNIDWYYLLLHNDPEFKELFKTHAVFENTSRRTEDTELEYIRFIKKYTDTNNLKPLNKEAVGRVVEQSARLSDNQGKLILNYNKIYKLLDEADAWASIEGKEVIDLDSIEKALQQQKKRSNRFNEVYNESILEGTLLIDTEGNKVGEINGLAVVSTGEYSVGMPIKFTANTYRGAEGVISIDRNVKMSGSLHDKGVETVKGFLGKTFAEEKAFSLVANVSFEQNYGGIDGDSATSTTLYAILSDLSNTPINQSIAVSGSMNQKGEVQAVGGINEKVEGFFSICKERGLTGEQGVIIPLSNVRNLMLSKEVREAVESEQFHIYAVDNVKDGIEILTGENFDTIKSKIEQRISSLKVDNKK